MKIEKLIEVYVSHDSVFSDYVEIDISPEDITAQIHEMDDCDNWRDIDRMVSNCWRVLKSLPDGYLKQLSEDRRKVIYDGFQESLKRILKANQ